MTACQYRHVLSASLHLEVEGEEKTTYGKEADCGTLSPNSEGSRKTASVEMHTWNLVTKPVLKAGLSHRTNLPEAGG